MPSTLNRNVSINLRVLPAQRSLIDKAANLLGKSRSDFMLEVSCREAMDVLLDQHLFLLDKQQFHAFEQAISTPLSIDQQHCLNKLLGTPMP